MYISSKNFQRVKKEGSGSSALIQNTYKSMRQNILNRGINTIQYIPYPLMQVSDRNMSSPSVFSTKKSLSVSV